MKTKASFVVTAALLALAMALPAAAKGLYLYTFDESVKPFTASTSDVNKQYSFEHQCEDPIGDGPTNGFVGLKMVPYSTESAVWMLVELEGGYGAEDVNVTFNARNLGGCKSCTPVVYVGELPPVKAAQFVNVASPKDPPLADNWLSYHHKATIKTDGQKPVYLALGWRAQADMLKSAGAVGFDNVEIIMAPTP
jgi:hypothetical protein